jgi:hypothetical protein
VTRRIVAIAFAVLLAASPASADFGAGNNLLGFWAKRSTPTITTMTYVANTVSEGTTITLPATINAGDLLVLIQCASDGDVGAPADVTPSGGWADIPTSVSATTGSGSIRLSGKYKIADGTEDSAVTTGMNGSLADGKVAWQFRGNLAIATLSLGAAVGDATANNPAQQTILASSGTPPVVGITGFCDATGSPAVSPRTTSITPDHEISTTGGAAGVLWSHDYVQNSSPANYTFDMDDEGASQGIFGFYIHNFAP